MGHDRASQKEPKLVRNLHLLRGTTGSEGFGFKFQSRQSFSLANNLLAFNVKHEINAWEKCLLSLFPSKNLKDES